MQTCIFCISAADIFIIVECIFIIFWQPLFFIIAVFDIRLQDIIVFMSDAVILVEAIEEWFIELDVCAIAGPPAAKARRIGANKIFVGFMMHQGLRAKRGYHLNNLGASLFRGCCHTSVRLRSRHR